jgi:hypothetical protein
MRWAAGLLVVVVAGGCDRGAEAPTTAPVAEQPTSLPTTIPATNTLEVEGRVVPFPAAEFVLAPDGSVMLSAAGDGPEGNAIALVFTPEWDPGRDTASFLFELTSAESPTTDGLYIGSAEYQLRPIRLLLAIRIDGARAVVDLEGRFAPADSADPMTAPAFTARGRIVATVRRQ